MVNGEVKARDISKYLSGTKACQSTTDTKSRGLRNDIASFLILDENRTHLTKQHDTVNYNQRFIYCTRKLSSFAENIPDVLNQSLQFMIRTYPGKYNINTFIVDNN